ncbi:hypothetical protein AAHN97_07660 [Chitinophaga niabensis]|uniref:hypothetical protein n=1 Tax=Chitinophaga niabensis TaxID=536979 RepID=UPI0031B9D321
MDISKKTKWTWKDGLDHFRKMIAPPDKALIIQNELTRLNSRLPLENGFLISDKNRQSQIITGLADGSISIDFWENGICWHTQLLKDIPAATNAAYLWNDIRENSGFIEKEIPSVLFPEKRKQIEISSQQYIKWHWQHLVYGNTKTENEFIELLKDNSTITKLMTFHQLWDFGLSRHIGNYGNDLKNDLLRAKIQDKIIEVRTEEMARDDYGKGVHNCIGKGDAPTAYKLIVDNLPADLDWAEYQTLEQYLNRTGLR